MSESDDTELLLLIPPDLFLLKESESDFSSRSSVIKTQSPFCDCSLDVNRFFDKNNNIEHNPDMASHCYNLPYQQQNEIDRINAKISQVERNFTAMDSDMSTTSNPTVLTKSVKQPMKDAFSTDYFSTNITTSTPKHLNFHPKYYENIGEDNGILKEIDKYLEEKVQTDESNKYPNEHNKVFFRNGPNIDRTSLNNTLETIHISNNNKVDQCSSNTLISLSELWENKNIGNVSSNILLKQLQEEKLRRQHCEKTIQALQIKLLEYQQKISVALQVDKVKDNAIGDLKDENEKLKNNLQKLENSLKEIETKCKNDNEKLQNEVLDIKTSKECLEKELSQALNLAAKFQDKNEILEIKIENFTKSTDEMGLLYKKQIEDMEIRVINAEKSEDIANTELKKIQDILVKTQLDLEKASMQMSVFKKQADSLQIKCQRLEKMEEQNKGLNESLLKLTRRENELLKELETQKIALKTHYQHQLERVVEQKLVEFQTQLDSVEETLKSEAKEREKTIAERAIRQLEMINEKNDQEIQLINEKHNEEVGLFRIQLINATKKIEELEEILKNFRNRRVDIAEKLHTVMETQWQKALEILTSPTTNVEHPKCTNPVLINKEKLDGLSADSGITKPENESFNTPTSSRNRTHNRKNDERLQAYIELLLSKSPRDLDNLNTILNLPKNDFSSNERSKSSQHSKPPWK
ncbi:putative autophagy-related protein 11 [Condylostylus longicornis]|uniref:putative autophagy-related protein 11 n=1 Tax=Condylostylus longicornis TaxID=2530218 RepID=UPI00244E22B8|nr:putative autophagy-related protein 11 [Condylostylus longicornis]